MVYVREDVYEALDRATRSLESLTGQLAGIREMLASGAMTRVESDKVKCPECGVEYATADRVEEHRRNVHGLVV